VKWNDLGDLEYIGRIDRQIKIRGYRVELDGIENIINRFPGVTGNHLRVEGQNLLSYVTPSNINLEKFKKYLEANLPQHAVPSQFFLLENFPINSTGKIDMKRLPMPDKLQKKDLPVGPGEIKMADLWQNILKIKDPISPKDNFFDLGGNSLSAIKLTHFLRKEISNSNLPIELIYLNPTLASYTASTLEFKLDLAKTDDNSFPILDLIKSLPSTLYFVVAWLIPTLGFLILLPKFPFLIFYYLFELVFFGLFGEKIKPIFQIIRNKINLDQLNFKEIKIVDSGLPNNLQGVIFCLHPHGLMDIHSLPLERHLFKKNISYRSTFERKLFWCPFLRTFLYLLGYIPATSENFKKKGINILTTPGDVAEFLQCGNPSTVFLSSNKIFFKLAIENGLTIVPIYAFDTEKSFKFYPSLNKWRDKVKVGVQTVAIVPFSGRFYLPIPFKTRTKVVIGEPLEIEKMENPSWKRIEETEKLYIEQLEKIYNTHRENNSPDLKIL
jgi:1-acyl-sn-glycerol-3-phosphate acyltransferase